MLSIDWKQFTVYKEIPLNVQTCLSTNLTTNHWTLRKRMLEHSKWRQTGPRQSLPWRWCRSSTFPTRYPPPLSPPSLLTCLQNYWKKIWILFHDEDFNSRKNILNQRFLNVTYVSWMAYLYWPCLYAAVQFPVSWLWFHFVCHSLLSSFVE